MDSPDGSDKKDIQLDDECKRLAHDARSVHEWLKPILQQSAAAKGAYAVKDRLKPWHEIRQKVMAKRLDPDLKKRKPDYKPARVTDASGFRIVSLFNSDIPDALDKFLALLVTPPPGPGRFSDPCVKQIIFYSSRRDGDPLSIKPEVERVVGEHKLKGVYEIPEESASSYSSVHVIIETEIGSGDDLVSAHSEIQLRSVFEEAWSEINHRLLYAPAKRARAATETDATPGTEARESDHHLDALKSLTDGCAQYADLIKRQFLDSQPDPAKRAPKSVEPIKASLAAFQKCPRNVIAEIEKAFQLRAQAEEMPSEDPGRPGAFANAAEAIKAALDLLTNSVKGDSEKAAAERLGMQQILIEERAYCLMFTANSELLSQAEQLYRELLAQGREEVSVYFRLGQICRDEGHYDEAKVFLEEAVSRAEANPEANHPMSVIRRDLGYVCWRLFDLSPTKESMLHHLREAIQLTELAVDTASNETQLLSARNNLLYYHMDVLPWTEGTQKADLLEKITTGLEFFRSRWDVEHWTTLRLDTLLRAEHLVGDAEKARTIATDIIRRLHGRMAEISKSTTLPQSRIERLNLLSRDEQDMLLFAQEIAAT